jgi:hypothetical protein
MEGVMATLAEIYNLKNSSSLRNRIAVALTKAAEDVRNEGAGTANHAERFMWATGLLSSARGPEQEAERAMWLFLQNATIQDAGEAATDGDIQFMANALVDFLAGVDTAAA